MSGCEGVDPRACADEGDLDAGLAQRVAVAISKGRAFLLEQQEKGGVWDDPAFGIPGKSGDTAMVVSGNGGGACYYPGGSTAGYAKRSDGKYEARSYGSMSHALLPCLVFAGVSAEDRRVQMVVTWIREHGNLERNPGFEHAEDPEKAGQQGWFYYVHTAARTLAEYEQHTGKSLAVTDAEGTLRNWRKEVIAILLARQAGDGSGSDDKAERWEEGSQVLATGRLPQAVPA